MSQDPQQLPQTVESLEALRFGFDQLPLDHFRGMTAEEIEAHGGIGPKFRQRIQEQLAELDQLRTEAGVPIPEAPARAEAPAAGPDPAPAPRAKRGGFLAGLVVALVIAVVVFFGIRATLEYQYEGQLRAARSEVQTTQQVLSSVSGSVAKNALDETERAYQKVRARNYGDALERLDSVDQSLRAMLGAGNGGGTVAQQAARVAAAQQALSLARQALLLQQAATHQQLEDLMLQLYNAVRVLKPEEVKG